MPADTTVIHWWSIRIRMVVIVFPYRTGFGDPGLTTVLLVGARAAAATAQVAASVVAVDAGSVAVSHAPTLWWLRCDEHIHLNRQAQVKVM
ncbi:hypothetical protein [Sphaerisporangium perillae]|uniref:hypothetical protein n=1 Tax=Sphaerisporangium perillae TaxID=2935860 RepID=UPI00200F0CFF|nr:hypothetical protein [Sphaerisporangium perillae]